VSLRGPLFCHCEERSDEAVPLFVTARSEAKQSQRLLRMVRSLYEQKTLQGTGALVSATEKVYNVDVAVLM